MKILTICQYYYPEPFKVHEICEELVKRGHEVTVITGRPNYPDGKLYDGYDDKMHERINGVDVIRTPIRLRGNNPISLIRNYFSYPLEAKKKMKRIPGDYDVVFVYQLSPVFMIYPALYYKKKYEKKVFVYCLDLWPESLKVLHIKKSNPVFKIIKKISNRLYSKCDFITVTSPAFTEYLAKENNVKKSKIKFIPQHGEQFFLNVKPYRKQNVLNITFAGNIGKAQDFDCLIRAVSSIPVNYYAKFKIIIIGSGSYEDTLKQKVGEKKLNNLFQFTGRKKTNELLPYYDKTSLFLLSLEKNSEIGKTIPSKLQTYMAAGRGIIGSIDGAAEEIIKNSKSGKVCHAGDYVSLSKIIIEMINKDDDYIKKLSENSRKWFLENYKIEKHVDKLEKELKKMTI